MKFFHEREYGPGMGFGIFGTVQDRVFLVVIGKHMFGVEFT